MVVPLTKPPTHMRPPTQTTSPFMPTKGLLVEFAEEDADEEGAVEVAELD